MKPAESVNTYGMTVRADLTVANNGGTVNDFFAHGGAEITFDLII